MLSEAKHLSLSIPLNFSLLIWLGIILNQTWVDAKSNENQILRYAQNDM
jgi:hypothetical protein